MKFENTDSGFDNTRHYEPVKNTTTNNTLDIEKDIEDKKEVFQEQRLICKSNDWQNRTELSQEDHSQQAAETEANTTATKANMKEEKF